MPLHVLAWERYLAGMGIQIDDLERRMHGKRNSELVRDMINADLAEDVIFKHGAAKEKLFRELLVEGDLGRWRIAGVKEFLERHKDVPKAIGSNAEPQNIEFVLDQLGLKEYFDTTVNGMEVSRPKPFPDIYLEAARRLGYVPADCIVFEDSPTGVTAGRAAGMRVVGVETTPGELAGVELRVNDFADPRLERWVAAQLEAQ